MSELNRLFDAGRRVRLAARLSLASLVLLALVGGSLTARWTTRARSQASEEALLPTTGVNTEANPVSSPTADLESQISPAAEAPAVSTSQASVSAEQSSLPPAFTVTWTRTATTPDGQSRPLPTTTRYQRADGIYKLVHTYPAQEKTAGREEVAFGFTSLGVFRLDRERQQLVFVSPLLEDGPEDVQAVLREDPRFTREEDVLGQRTIVLRTPAPWGAGYTEYYRAPALGGLLLKSVEETPRRGRQVMEPAELVMGEPDAGLFAELGQYPADYAAFERRIAQMDRDEGRDTAQYLRELMRRMQIVKPASR